MTSIVSTPPGAVSKATTWLTNRLHEGSTWLGGAIVAVGTASFPTTGIAVLDHYTPFVQHVAQFAGVAMAAMSTKRP